MDVTDFVFNSGSFGLKMLSRRMCSVGDELLTAKCTGDATLQVARNPPRAAKRGGLILSLVIDASRALHRSFLSRSN
jgi:hypothetical protein